MRGINTRLHRDRPVIVEGVTVLRQVVPAAVVVDFLICVDNASAPVLQPQYERPLKEYEREFSPRQRADFTLTLDH